MTGAGCILETWPQTSVTDTVSIVIPRGFTSLSSSKMTSKLLLGLRNDLGIWYLKIGEHSFKK